MRLSRLKLQIDKLIKEWGPNQEVKIYDNIHGDFHEIEILGICDFDPDEDTQQNFLVLHSKHAFIDEILGNETGYTPPSER